MESALGFLFALIFLGLFIFLGAVVYKNRTAVKQWLNTPYYAEDDRKLRLQRKIEDYQSELKDIEEREQAETGE